MLLQEIYKLEKQTRFEGYNNSFEELSALCITMCKREAHRSLALHTWQVKIKQYLLHIRV